MLQLLCEACVSPESQVEAGEITRQVWEAMGQLSPRQSEVIVQRYFLAMSENEMANIHQVAPGTIKWLLHAARKKLQGLLGKEREVL
jgi:RNA polymerase sigma-70 factor, ECF subfamily